MRFDQLGLLEPIGRAVAHEGYTTPTPIQTKAIPPVLAGRDVLGCAQTGTGKTGAFALPILHRLADAGHGQAQAQAATQTQTHGQAHSRPRNGRARNGKANGKPQGARGQRPRVLVLCPTRELATQIAESFRVYGRFLPLRHTVVFGGVSQVGQVNSLRAGTDVVVATPGRLLDLMNQRVIDLRGIETLVLDEADRMLDMGFINDIRRVVAQLPERRQTLLFSATMPPEIRGLANSILVDPVHVQVAAVSCTADAIAQSVYHVAKKNKAALLGQLLGRGTMERTLVFTRTKHGADKVVRVLNQRGLNAAAIHGNKSQGARTRALDGFKTGRTPVLVATDIASRGLDVDEISHVVNFDVPNIPETYVHRIGRTARAGASGEAFSFCDREELGDLRAIERLIDKRIDVVGREALDMFGLGDNADDRSDVEATGHRSGSAAGDRRRRGGGRRRGGAQPRAGAAGKPKVKPKSNGRSAPRSNAAATKTGATSRGPRSFMSKGRAPRKPRSVR